MQISYIKIYFCIFKKTDEYSTKDAKKKFQSFQNIKIHTLAKKTL